MTEPPSFWLMAPFAVAAGWHTLRAVRLRVSTHGLVGGGAANLVMLAYAPAALSMLNAETLTPLAPVIEWCRHYVLALLVLAAILSEFALRFIVIRGAARLGEMAERQDDPSLLAKVCDALQALRCHDLAIVGLRRLAEMGHAESSVRSSLAALYGIQRRFLQAEASARKAIALDPSNGMAHFYLSAALYEQGRTEEQEASRAEAARLGVDLSQFEQRILKPAS
jgi:tetratricopeptide (TPR) repeat protein